MDTRYTLMPSPLGDIFIARTAQRITAVCFQNGRTPMIPQPGWQRDDTAFADIFGQLNSYFAGERHEFDLPLAPQGTPFQLTVWHALQQIPYGQTTTYGELARTIGNPQAVRAVGAANGRNPIPIIIPCHRVIGSDGSLTGYGGGLHIKEALLSLEQHGRVLTSQQLSLF